MTEYTILLPTARDSGDNADSGDSDGSGDSDNTEASPARFPSATEAVLQGMLWESIGLLEPGWDWGQV